MRPHLPSCRQPDAIQVDMRLKASTPKQMMSVDWYGTIIVYKRRHIGSQDNPYPERAASLLQHELSKCTTYRFIRSSGHCSGRHRSYQETYGDAEAQGVYVSSFPSFNFYSCGSIPRAKAQDRFPLSGYWIWLLKLSEHQAPSDISP